MNFPNSRMENKNKCEFHSDRWSKDKDDEGLLEKILFWHCVDDHNQEEGEREVRLDVVIEPCQHEQTSEADEDNITPCYTHHKQHKGDVWLMPLTIDNLLTNAINYFWSMRDIFSC